jgi:hypothetical protein
VTAPSFPAHPSARPFDQRRWWPWALAVSGVWVAVLHATLWWLDRHPLPRVLWGDEKTYLTAALELLAGARGWWTEPLWPPLYPQFVAGLVWLGGGSLTVVVLVQSLLLAATAVVLFDLTRRFVDSRAAGVVVASLTLGYPPLAAFSHYLWPEILHLFLFVTLLWILAARIRSPVWCAVAGVVLGLAVLSKSLLLPFVPVLLLVGVWGTSPRTAAWTIVLVSGTALVTVSPVLIGNARRTGSPSIASSAAFNLWVGLNDVGRESFRHDVVWPEFQRWTASADTNAERNRILRTRIGDLVRERGLPAVLENQISKQYFRLFDAGCYFTDQLPGGPASERAGAGYLGLDRRVGGIFAALTIATILLLYVVAPTGLLVGGCRGRKWVRTLVVFLAYNLALFFWLHVKTRYRIQMLPAAFVGVGCLVAWLEAGCRPRPSRERAVAAGLVVGLLIWLALA